LIRFVTASPFRDLKALYLAADSAETLLIFFLFAVSALCLIKLVIAKEPFPRTAIDIPLVFFLVVTSFSLLYSPEKDTGSRQLFILFSDVAVFYALISCLRSKYRAKVFIMLLIAAAVMVSLLGLIHYFLIYRDMPTEGLPIFAKHMVDIGRIGSVFGWPNILAGFLALIIPVSFMSIFAVKNKGEKFCMALATAILAAAMFLTHSIL
jgi:hypothetical protein